MAGIAPIYPPAMWSPYDTNEREWKRPTPLTPTPSTPTSCTSSAAKFVRDLGLFSSPDAKLDGAEGHDDDDDCEPENLREALAEAPSAGSAAATTSGTMASASTRWPGRSPEAK